MSVSAEAVGAGLPGADLFVRADAPLRPANAVAALLLLDDGRYLMQLRDALPQIFYPDHWGCFGGAVDAGERPLAALRRELREELELELGEAREFTRFDFDFSELGHGSVYRIYYEARLPEEAVSGLVLHEGAQMRAFEAGELLAGHRLAPYDAFALWLHASRRRFTQQGT